MRKKICFIILLLLSAPFLSSANFDFNTNCLKAFQQIGELKLNAARAQLNYEKKTHPANSIVPLLENYLDYYYLLSIDSKAEFERLERNKSVRLNQIDEDPDNNSPYKLFALAEINLQWALIRGRYGSYYTAAREINRANNDLTDNAKRFPSFHLNAKGLGLINVLMGSLPDGFLKSALATFGIKGNVQNGLNMLERLADNLPKSAYEPFYEDVVFAYLYILNDVIHSPSAYNKTLKYTARFADSSLTKTFLIAYVSAKSGHTDEAISALSNRPQGNSYQSFPYLDYLMGFAKLNKLDFSAAAHFERFLQTNKGDSYIKDANLRLGWISLLKGDENAYNNSIAKVRSGGYVFQEKDKQAINEANAPIPNKNLLSSRLLFDGGFTNQALQQLSGLTSDSFAISRDKAEFSYRLGRIYDDMGKDDLAANYYQNAINLGKNLRQYYAARAAVLMGNIYEKKKNVAKAKAAYTTAIALKNHEYETGIEYEAKQGLKRLN